MAAGWPLVFQQWGADSVLVVERNALQVQHVLGKYDDNSEIGLFLRHNVDIILSDINDIPTDFWHGRVCSNSFVFLSNICDHAEREGRIDVFVQQIVSMVSAIDGGGNITVAMTSFGTDLLAKYKALLQIASSANGMIVEGNVLVNPFYVDSELLTTVLFLRFIKL